MVDFDPARDSIKMILKQMLPMRFSVNCPLTSRNLNKNNVCKDQCLHMSVWSKHTFSESIEDIWLALNVDGPCIVIWSVISAAEVS